MKKMKFACLVLVAAFILCLPMGVSAAESPNLPAVPTPDAGSTSGLPADAGLLWGYADGNGAEATAIENYVKSNNPNGAIVGIVDIKVHQGEDASGNAIFLSSVGNAVTIKVTAPGVTSSNKIYVVHRLGNGNIEVLNATASNGSFTFSTSSFSTFAWVIGGSFPTSSGGSGSGSGSSSSSGTTARSPQTGVYA